MQKFAKMVIWCSFGLVALGLTAWLCVDLIESQPVIMAVILTAACLSAVGPAYVRHLWRNGTTGSAVAALWLVLLAGIVLAFTESSYWSSSIENMHEQATGEKATRDGKAIVAQKRRERYTNLANGQTPEQIQAKIDAKSVDARYARSNGCASATQGGSRVFCTEYFALKADLAAATEARSLEGTVWAGGTKQEPFLKRNFYQAAILGSLNLGGNIQAWILGIVLTMVVFLSSLLHLSFFIAFAPEPRQDRATASKAPEATETPLKVYPPVQRAARGPVVPWIELPSKSSHAEIPRNSPPHPPKPNYPKFSDSSPDDTPPPGDKAPVAETESPVEKVAAKLELVTDGGKSVPKSLEPQKSDEKVAQKVIDFPTKIKRKKYGKVKANKHGKVGRVVDWHAETATQTSNPKVRVSSEDCYGNYETWCTLNELYAVPWRTFTKKLTALLRIKNPERNSKNGQRMFPLLLTDPSQWQQKRKVRAA